MSMISERVHINAPISEASCILGSDVYKRFFSSPFRGEENCVLKRVSIQENDPP